jgi:glycosyltransferase involved in cell wall biosynthesis
LSEQPDFQVAIVSPIFNEEEIILERSISLAKHMDELVGEGNWYHIFVDNGSSDSTPQILNDILKQRPDHKIVRTENPNFGDALRTGILSTTAPWVYVFPIDEWDVPFLNWAWNNKDKYDLLMGSKRADPTLNNQHPYRKFLSWGLNALLQLFFQYPGTDTHGGKLLRREKISPIVKETVMRYGQFDTEFVLRSYRGGHSLVEVPVSYNEIRSPRNMMIVKIVRNIRDVVRLRSVLNGVKSSANVQYRRYSRSDILS